MPNLRRAGIRGASILLAAALLPTASGALEVRLAPGPVELDDGQPWALPSSPGLMVPLRDGMVYVAGRDLFWSDGTRAGTRLLATLCGLGCTEIVALGHGADVAFFGELIVDYSGFTTERVVRTDGTAAGTFAVSGVLSLNYSRINGCPAAGVVSGSRVFFPASVDGECQPWTGAGSPGGAASIDPLGRVDSLMVALGEDVYYLGASGATQGLFRIDGQAMGVELVRALDFSTFTSTENVNLVAASQRLFFLGRNQLWTSDGTAAGTRALTRFTAGSGARTLLAAVGGRAWFVAADDAGEELWSSDGSEAGTRRATDLPDPQPFRGGLLAADRLAWIGGRLVFPALDSGPARLWSTSGNWRSTRRVQGSPVVAPGRLALLDGRRAVFVAMRGGLPSELWVTNGFGAGTARLLAGARFEQLATVRDGVLFIERDGADAFVGATDGTAAGTIGHLAAAAPEGEQLATASTSLGGVAYFPALDAQGRGGALWAVTPGAPAAREVFLPPPHTAQLRSPPYEDTYDLQLFGRAGGKLVAWRWGRGLYATDGDTVTRLLDAADIEYGSDSVDPTAAGDGILMLTTEESDALGDKHELWGTDGTPAGTFHVPIDAHTEYLGPVALADRAIFAIGDFNAGVLRLWHSDATRSGTSTEAAIPGDFGGSWLAADAVRICLLLATDEPNDDRQIWCSDGTAGGTYPLGPHLAFDRIGYLSGFALTPAGVTLCGRLTAYDDDPQTTLVTVDAAGTVDDIRDPEIERGLCRGLFETTAGRSWLFLERSGAFSLWSTDGTQEGTARLAAIPEPASGPVALGAAAFFFTRDARSGLQLWRSDGTPGGTGPVAVVGSADQPHTPRMLVVRGRLWFVGFDREHGLELWSSDGTTAGTRRETDLAPGPASSGMSSLVAVGDRIYFLADDTRRSGIWWVDLE
ncbi:MAG TPA: hypothetical protein VGS57_08080 [Thermoanaerobaculia bacterium]|jgi:ELWxxDGT repeat protein|nr:hypothetical protein [Thermoanaerobaculia bacterium]